MQPSYHGFIEALFTGLEDRMKHWNRLRFNIIHIQTHTNGNTNTHTHTHTHTHTQFGPQRLID